MSQITYKDAVQRILELLEKDEVVERSGFRVDRKLPGLVGEYLGGVLVRIIVPEGHLPDTVTTSATLHWIAKLWCHGDEEWERIEPFLLNLTAGNKWGCSFQSLYAILGDAEQQGNRKPWLWQRQEYESLADKLRTQHEVNISIHKSLALPRHYWMEIRHDDAMLRVRALQKSGSCQIGLLANGHINDLPNLIEFMKKNPQQLAALKEQPMPDVDDSALKELARA